MNYQPKWEIPVNIYKPETGLLVQLQKLRPEGVFAFDAAFLEQSIRAKYQVK